jgi:putative membrane-bound dehydrogenase-like protein
MRRHHPAHPAALRPLALYSAVLFLCAAGLATGDTIGTQSGTRSAAQAVAGPLTPEQALREFDIEPGYRIELVASEPLIRDPVAMAFDERGRLFVVENRGYPDPLDPSTPPSREGVVALLEDVDGDGRFDKRSEFATDLTYPNGVMPWRGGVFVTSAPDLLFLRDTTGDGVADERRVVLTGFDTTKTAQIRFSHPTLGLDNWVYLTGGLNGGRVTSPDHPGRPAVEFTNSDSRFNPFTYEFETSGGQGQFGLTFDDYGRRFICSNRHPVRHVVLTPRHLKRNPHLAFSDTMADVSKVGADAVVWPISADMTTASFMPTLINAPHAGTFTAASGVHVHRGDALPQGHQGSLFICESAQNLVQRQVITPSGVTFSSSPARSGREFLATRDSWFRPVFSANGPDGALYIADMYRRVIDHPQYVPEGSRALLDFQAGKERGRIYRIAASGWKPDRTRIDTGAMTAAEVSRALEHPNAWWRETAQRLIVERRDRTAVPHVRQVAAAGRDGAARVHALWTLAGLDAVDTADLTRAFGDSEAAVRENAVRVAEERLATARELASHVLRLAGDPDGRVRFHVALALGETDDPRAVAALAAIARGDGADPWVRAAVLSAVGGRVSEFLRAFENPPVESRAVRAAVMQDLGHLFGAAESPERCLDLIDAIAAPAADFGWQPAALAGLAQGLRARGQARGGRSALTTLLASSQARARSTVARVDALMSRAASVALDPAAPTGLRLPAISLLGHTSYPDAGTALERLLGPEHQADIQLASVRALAQLPGRHGAESLTDAGRWSAFTPRVREAVLSALMTEERHMMVLLDAVRTKAIAVTAVNPSRRGRLTSHSNPEIQQQARAVFATLTSGDRMQVYERLRAAVKDAAGDPQRGRAMFESRCGACHRFNAAGGTLGPDLSGLRNQPADAILLHAIVPGYEIAPGYEAYMVTTRDGRSLVGRLQSETPGSLTLVDASGAKHAILRADVMSMTASAASLMPDELERGMSNRDVADLLAYLKAEAPAGGPGSIR